MSHARPAVSGALRGDQPSRRHWRLRTGLAVLVAGPLLVLCTLVASTTSERLSDVRAAGELHTAAITAMTAGQLEALVELERAAATGWNELSLRGLPGTVVADLIGFDLPKVAAQSAKKVDAVVVELGRMLADRSALDAWNHARRALLDRVFAGVGVPVEELSEMYDGLSPVTAPVHERLANATEDGRSRGAVAARGRLASGLRQSELVATWATAVAHQSRLLSIAASPADKPGDLLARLALARNAEEQAVAGLAAELADLPEPLAPGAARNRWLAVRDDAMRAVGLLTGPLPATSADLLAHVAALGGSVIQQIDDALPVLTSQVESEVAQAAGNIEAQARSSLQRLLSLLAAGLALVVLWSMIVVRWISRPLRFVVERAEAIEQGRIHDPPLPRRGPREVVVLTDAIEAMTSTVRLFEEQTEALGAGRLEDPILTRTAPGELGASVQASLSKVSDLTDRLAHQARRDPMTSLPNRTAALERTAEALDRLRRNGTPMALLYVDLDGFKNVNDAYGHGAGDVVLVEIARRFRMVCRSGELLARIGGDEFVVVAESCPTTAEAEALARRLIAATERPVVCGTGEAALSASVGLALGRPDHTPLQLLGESDQAVYQAKREGRGRVRAFDAALQAAIEQRASLETDLRRALAAGEIELHYQPIVDAETQRLHGAEALARWRHPTRGLLPPAEFIPVAEQSWLIVELGRVVLDQACAQLATWQAEGLELRLSVNVAGRHVMEGDLFDDLCQALARHDVPASRLRIEITESHLMKDLEAASAVLNEVRSLGVQIALDDFGTGYSSLSYLRSLPIDIMKIDRVYVGELDGPGQGSDVVDSLLHLASSLSLDVVAEGVETDVQAQRLTDLGCAYLQGFLIARPMPASDFGRWAGRARARGIAAARA